MTDDTIRYLADWAGLILLVGIGVTGALFFVYLAIKSSANKR